MNASNDEKEAVLAGGTVDDKTEGDEDDDDDDDKSAFVSWGQRQTIGKEGRKIEKDKKSRGKKTRKEAINAELSPVPSKRSKMTSGEKIAAALDNVHTVMDRSLDLQEKK